MNEKKKKKENRGKIPRKENKNKECLRYRGNAAVMEMVDWVRKKQKEYITGKLFSFWKKNKLFDAWKEITC